MPWKKGQSGNPNGRPKKGDSTEEKLWAAIKTVEKRKRKKLLIHAVEQSFEDNKLLINILKKILPDMKYVESDVNLPQEITIKWKESPPKSSQS